ncbi:MAG: OsmC family protein, partial [Actinobacteria bacterium]|nr:OsmC family protein [Actinomycetota bacterium]
MDVRATQRPLKERYRDDADAARVTLSARASEGDAPVACSVELARAIYEAQAHAGVGGPGAGACSGDLLLGALAACAQITAQMVAAAMAIPTRRIEAVAEGDLDLRGTLGVDRDAPVGFETIRLD